MTWMNKGRGGFLFTPQSSRRARRGIRRPHLIDFCLAHGSNGPATRPSRWSLRWWSRSQIGEWLGPTMMPPLTQIGSPRVTAVRLPFGASR